MSGGGRVRTRVSCETPSGYEPARFVLSRTPPSCILTIGDHKVEHVLVEPIIESEDKLIKLGLQKSGAGF